jgi:hypothetical protein
LLVAGVVIPAVLLTGTAGFALSGRKYDEGFFGPVLRGFAVWIPLFVLMPALVVMVEGARRETARRAGFLGLRRPDFQKRLSILMIVLSLLPLFSEAAWFIALMMDESGLGIFTAKLTLFGVALSSGLVVLWLTFSFLLGYAFPTANVRHRLIAARLFPVMLIAAMTFSVLALALHPVERGFVRKAIRDSHSVHLSWSDLTW